MSKYFIILIAVILSSCTIAFNDSRKELYGLQIEQAQKIISETLSAQKKNNNIDSFQLNDNGGSFELKKIKTNIIIETAKESSTTPKGIYLKVAGEGSYFGAFPEENMEKTIFMIENIRESLKDNSEWVLNTSQGKIINRIYP